MDRRGKRRRRAAVRSIDDKFFLKKKEAAHLFALYFQNFQCSNQIENLAQTFILS